MNRKGNEAIKILQRGFEWQKKNPRHLQREGRALVEQGSALWKEAGLPGEPPGEDLTIPEWGRLYQLTY